MAKETPSIELEFDGRGLFPLTALDAELLDAYPKKAEFRAVEMKRRSYAQLKLYWAGLERIVEATEMWPTKEHLHRAILLACRYFKTTYTLGGEPRIEVDSASFASMNQREFNLYFKKARAVLLVEADIDWDEVMPAQMGEPA